MKNFLKKFHKKYPSIRDFAFGLIFICLAPLLFVSQSEKNQDEYTKCSLGNIEVGIITKDLINKSFEHVDGFKISNHKIIRTVCDKDLYSIQVRIESGTKKDFIPIDYRVDIKFLGKGHDWADLENWGILHIYTM